MNDALKDVEIKSTRKYANGVSKFFMLLVTVFAALFLLSFFYSRMLRNEVHLLKKMVKAYELYVNGSEDFEKFVKENNLKDLNWLADRFSYAEARRRLDEAKKSYQVGNYGDAIAYLSELKDRDVPWLDEVYYLLGLCYARTGQDVQARFFLSAFLQGFKDSVFRKDALEALLKVVPESEQEVVRKELQKLQ